MSTYKYAAASGYLSPNAGVPYRPTDEDTGPHSYRGYHEVNTKSYHSRSNHYAKSTHSFDVRSARSADGKSTYSNGARSYCSMDSRSPAPTFDAGSIYSPQAKPARPTDAGSTYTPDTKPIYSHQVWSAHSGDPYSMHPIDARSVRPTDTRSVYPTGARSVCSTGARSTRSKSRTPADPEPQPQPHSHSHSQQYLTVQASQPHHRRCPSTTRSHRSRVAPSLTHSVQSTSSDEDSESDTGRSVNGLNTPYTAKVALWRDDVRDMCDEMPAETILPPHIMAQYEYSQRQHEAPPSFDPTEIPSIVVPSHTTHSRASSPRSTSPPAPAPVPVPPSAPAPNLDRVVGEIEGIEYQINSRILAFTFPINLDLGERLPNGEFPPLPYTGRNKALIEHRDYLEKSLLRMDEIQSFGDTQIKGSRKRVVTKLEEQLEHLNKMEKMVRDNMHYELWKKTPRIHVTAPLAPT
ncbi:hypothetical protein BN14_04079 [Rhizoctonia solani AG-1 IB]|uniref:BAG domain-containing protein n=1 Tax=Thanatephorus cucumeris (strain AG1-IB / isolate 7/3/14) TaxID=1108050 RepID=M5BU87_THACB|nr:hypothetical protein BN14_04079 [Rhizoctonia solani AG-1 IB]